MCDPLPVWFFSTFGLLNELYASFIVCPPDHVTANVGATRASQCYSTNQCALGQDDCSWNANCIDLPDVNDIPAYKCSCKPGFKGNGTVCIGELFMIGQLDYLTLN